MYIRGEGADRFEKSYLDGDGMVTSVALKDGKAYFRNKFVRTEDFEKEEALGKLLPSHRYLLPRIHANQPLSGAFLMISLRGT